MYICSGLTNADQFSGSLARTAQNSVNQIKTALLLFVISRFFRWVESGALIGQ